MVAFSKYNPDATLSEEDKFVLVQIAVRYLKLPHPDVVAAFNGKALFPTARAGSTRGKRFDIWQNAYVLDDNASPAWALFWPHGLTGRPDGWRVAHLWARADDPNSYTNISNLCLIAAPLERLTDGEGPLLPYLKHHACKVYGWRPEDEPEPEAPPGYSNICWSYIEPSGSPIDNISHRFDTLNNQRIRLMRGLNSPMTWRQ